MKALACLLLASCIGAPDRATLSGGHGWGSSEGDIGGSKAVEQDGSSQWVGMGLEFPISYQEHRVDSCRRCDLLEEQVQILRQEARQEPPRRETSNAGLWLGSGGTAALGAILAALMRYGIVPTIKAREKAEA